MIFAKVIDGAIVHYPYTLENLQIDNPNTIFTLPLDAEVLADFNVVPVQAGSPPDYDPIQFQLIETEPVFEEGTWKQTFTLVEFTEEEKNARYNSLADWANFYNLALINPAFFAIRAAAAQSLQISAAYIDVATSLSMAAQGNVNVAAVQTALNNIISLMVGPFALNEEQQAAVRILLQECHLDRLITLNFPES